MITGWPYRLIMIISTFFVRLKENKIVNNTVFNANFMHVFVSTVDHLPQVFCVFMVFFRSGLELTRQNLIGLDVQKIRQRFLLELMRLFTPTIHLLFTELERNCDFLYLVLLCKL